MIITGQENIQKARLITLRAGLKLECAGMTRHGQSIYSIVKKEFGYKGNKVAVFNQLNDYLVSLGCNPMELIKK